MRRVLVVLSLFACACASRSTTLATEPILAIEPDASADPLLCGPSEFPDTPAGRHLEEVLGVFSSKDASTAEAFVSSAISPDFEPAQPREMLVRGIQGNGQAIVLCRVESSAPHQVTAILEDTGAAPGFEFGWVILAVDDDGLVTSLDVVHVRREDLELEPDPLDDDDVRGIVEDVAEGLAGYVFADKAAQMATAIREARDAGAYAGITEGRTLAWRLSNDLRAVTHDEHLAVLFRPTVFPPADPDWQPSPEEFERMKAVAREDHFGMPVAEIREGNVGYLVVNAFYPPEATAEALAKTMSKLADASALVIDLRDNVGGGPEGVALLTSYLFGPEPVHLFDFYFRHEDRTESSHTTPEAAGPRFGPSKPIFVLTSPWTISAGESFAYNLQAYGRATIVGETTAGAAHGTDIVPVAEHWAVALPTSRPIHPVTKANWEGTGVTPDLEVPAERALDEALELAGRGGKSPPPGDAGPS